MELVNGSGKPLENDNTKAANLALKREQAAVSFEMSVREVLAHYMAEGLTVSGAVATLALMQNEISMSHLLVSGHLDVPVKAAANRI